MYEISLLLLSFFFFGRFFYPLNSLKQSKRIKFTIGFQDYYIWLIMYHRDPPQKVTLKPMLLMMDQQKGKGGKNRSYTHQSQNISRTKLDTYY